jgi:hypothetical protein
LQKTWLCAAEVQLGLAHRTVQWCTGQCPVCQAGPSEKAALGTRWRRTAIIHRTVRWVVRGELVALGKRKRRCGYNSPDCPVVHRTVRWANGRERNGRPRNPRATRGPNQRLTGGTGLSGAPSCPKLQRSSAPFLEGNRALDSYSDCPVVHRTVRCTTQ